MFTEINPSAIELRGDVAGCGVIDYDFNEGIAVILAEAVLRALSRRKDIHKVLLSFDGRRKSSHYARAIAHLCKLRGLEVLLVNKPIPLTTTSWLVREYKLDLAFYVTGCHAPSRYCGLKILTWNGACILESDVREVESILKRESEDLIELSRTIELSTPDVVLDPVQEYVEHVTSQLSQAASHVKLRVVLDLSCGPALGIIDEALRKLGFEVKCVNSRAEEDVRHVTEPIYNLGRVQEIVVKTGSDLGLVSDYDFDEIGVAVPEGSLCCADVVSAALPEIIMKTVRRIACSVTCSHILESQRLGVRVDIIEVRPGTRFIVEQIIRGLADLGVDEEGVVHRNKVLVRDPVYVISLALQLLKELRERARSIDSVKVDMIEVSTSSFKIFSSMRDYIANFLKKFEFNIMVDEYYICAFSERGRIIVMPDLGYLIKIVHQGEVASVVSALRSILVK